MIKKISGLIAAILLLITFPTTSQTLCVGVVNPTANAQGIIDDASAKTLVTKLQTVLAKNGVAGDGSDFVLVPTIVIDEDELVESGMYNLYKITGSVNLLLKQLSTEKSFGSAIIPIRGTGRRTKGAAIKAALGGINVNDPKLKSFLGEARDKVVDYYLTNSASIIGKARNATQQGNYEEAFALLSSFPEGLPIEDQINDEINSTFKAYLDVNCQSAIIQAKAAMAQKNYDQANYILTNIDPRSSCYSDANSMVQEINDNLRAAEAQARADQLRHEQQQRSDMLRREAWAHSDKVRRESNAVALRKASINAARDVAKAYYQRTYPNYTIVYR